MTKHTNIHSRPQAGFSTVEALFALLLIGITLVIYTSSLNLIRLISATKGQQLAYHIAVHKMEDLRNIDFSSLPTSGNFSDPQMARLTSASGTITVTDIDSDLRQVRVQVSWVDRGTNKTINLTTLFYQNGISSL